MGEEKRCETCRFNPGVGHCLSVRLDGRGNFAGTGVCDDWESRQWQKEAADVGYKCGLANMARIVIQLIGCAEDCEIIDEPAANELKKTIRMAEQAYLLKRREKEAHDGNNTDG